MKYKVLYNTQIGNEFKAKDEVIKFPQGTDEGYIAQLVKNKVVTQLEETDDDEVKKGKKSSKHQKD